MIAMLVVGNGSETCNPARISRIFELYISYFCWIYTSAKHLSPTSSGSSKYTWTKESMAGNHPLPVSRKTSIYTLKHYFTYHAPQKKFPPLPQLPPSHIIQHAAGSQLPTGRGVFAQGLGHLNAHLSRVKEDPPVWSLREKGMDIQYPNKIPTLYGGFLKWWVSPTNMGFPTKNWKWSFLGCFGGTTI